MDEFDAPVGSTQVIRIKRTGEFFEGKVISYETRGRGMTKYVNIENPNGKIVTYPASAIETLLK